MSKRMWLGNVEHAQWVPMPKTGMQRSFEGNSNEFSADSGGLWIDDDGANHAVYNMEFPISDKGYEGIEAFTRFANGSYGKVSRLGRDGFIRFIDPMRSDDNLFNQVWAEPGIGEESDWGYICDGTPTFADVGANSYHQPLRAAVFTLTGTVADSVPVKPNSVFTLLVPPTHKIWLGVTGSVSGSAKIRVQPINLDGTLAATVDITPTSDATQPGFSNSFDGATYKAVKIYLTTNHSSNAGVATITSMRAQAHLSAITPASLPRHIPGLGHAGLKFRGGGRVETYVMATRKMIGASLVLAEVEPWWPNS
jgi:hypothetical protein